MSSIATRATPETIKTARPEPDASQIHPPAPQVGPIVLRMTLVTAARTNTVVEAR